MVRNNLDGGSPRHKEGGVRGASTAFFKFVCKNMVEGTLYFSRTFCVKDTHELGEVTTSEP